MAEKKQHSYKAADPTVTAEPEVKKVQAKPVGNATGLRIGAIVCWIFAFLLEALAYLILIGKVNLKFMPTLYQAILAIVLDLALVIIGSQLWKKANRIKPASKQNKVKFWLWNNMGMLVAVAAFVPLIILTLTNKDADKKTKTAVGIIGAIALAIALLFGHDWNPISSEDKAAMEGTYADSALPEGDVYITTTGQKFHLYEDCQHIKDRTKFSCKEAAAEEGKAIVDIAIEHGATEVCKTCEKKFADAQGAGGQ